MRESRIRSLLSAAAVCAALLVAGAAVAEDSEFKPGDEVEFVKDFVMSQVGKSKGEPWSVEKGERAKVRRAIKNDILIVGPDGERAWTKTRFLKKVEAGGEEAPAEAVTPEPEAEAEEAPAEAVTPEPEAEAEEASEEGGSREMTLSLDDGAEEPVNDGPKDVATDDTWGEDSGGGEAPAEEPPGEEPVAEEQRAEDTPAEPETEELTASAETDLDPVEAESAAEAEPAAEPVSEPVTTTAAAQPASDAPLPTWTVLAVGGAAVVCAVLGAGFGIAAADAKASHEEYTSSSLVDHVVVGNLEQRYEDRKLTANVMFGVAGGLAAAGVVALLLSEWGLYGGESGVSASVGPASAADGVVARAAFSF